MSMALKKAWKFIFKALSNPKYSIKENYKLHRKVIIASHPYFKPFYQMVDRKIRFDEREIPVRIFKPKVNKKKTPHILIFFHGGGWVTGSLESYSGICGHMADETGHIVISVGYRLAPEHPFPAGLEDCYHAAKFISQKVRNRRKNCIITLIGDSAGGNLATVVSLMAKKRNDFVINNQILLYPSTYNNYSDESPFDSVRENGEDYILTTKRIREYLDLYIENPEDLNSPLVAPLLEKDLSNQPKTLIITAQYDPLRDEGEAYGIRLKEAGNTVVIKRIDGALHGFLSLPKTANAVVECYKYINDFLQENTNK